MDSGNSIIGNYQELIDLAEANLQSVCVEIDNLTIDHIAYRAESAQDYEDIKRRLLEDASELLVELQIRGRQVSVIRLHKPLIYKNYVIPFFEILSPIDGGKQYGRKLEHIEIVTTTPLTEIISKYPVVKFNVNNLNREVNPELILTFPNDANVKFHPITIDEAIKLQDPTKL